MRGFFALRFAFPKTRSTRARPEKPQENLRTTHLKVMSDSCITSCEPCAMDTDESWLERLPLDVQLRLVSYLDGPSLARLTECTSKRLADAVSKELGPHWAHLHGVEIAAAKVVPSKPQPDEPLAFAKTDSPTSTLDANDVLGCKSAFVRCRSALELRCPNCGRHTIRGGRDAPLDDVGRYQSHLCKFFTVGPRARPRLAPGTEALANALEAAVPVSPVVLS